MPGISNRARGRDGSLSDNRNTATNRGGSFRAARPRQQANAGGHHHRTSGRLFLLLLAVAVAVAVGIVSTPLFRNVPFFTSPPPITREQQHIGQDTQTLQKGKAMSSSIKQRVVVIGGGLAGQAAAIVAAQHGALVTILEKEARLGGNSAKATSGINGWGTPAQAAASIADGPHLFENDTFLSGKGGSCQPGLVRMLSMRSADAVNWLSSFGVPLSVLSQLGGHSRPRTHRAPDKADGTPLPIGFTTVSTLEKFIRQELVGSVRIETQARLTALLHTTEQHPLSGDALTVVTGVEYEQHNKEDGTSTVVRLEADAVILATGGFSNDRTETSLLQEYAPHLASFPTTNGPWATGDGVKMARDLGVALVDMDKVQLHPTGLINPKDPQGKTVFLGPEALRGSGGILLNKEGNRFINELDLRSVVSQAIIGEKMEFPESAGRTYAYCVLNDAAADAFGRATLGFYWKKMGLFQHAENVSALAALIGCPEEKLRSTLKAYEESSSKKEKCALTGKSVFPCVLGTQGPYYVAYVTPSIHYTMGGCLISPSAEVQSTKQKLFGNRLPILGLFGAGEVTGGVHGGNRLGGNSLLECVVFGKIAGQRAATALSSPRLAFSPTTTSGHGNAPADWKHGILLERISAVDGAALEDVGGQLVVSLPSAYQTSGLSLLQRVALRHGDHEAMFVPSSSVSQIGSISVCVPPRSAGTHDWLYELVPGMEVQLAAGPHQEGAEALLQTGLAADAALLLVVDGPAGNPVLLQMLRTALDSGRRLWTSIHILYGASSQEGLSHGSQTLDICRSGKYPQLTCTVMLEKPPAGWTEGVGMIDFEAVRAQLPEKDATTVVLGGGGSSALHTIATELKAMQYRENVNLFTVTL